MTNTRVLVVEDEPVIAEVLERYLRRDGHEVACAGDGETALVAFEEFEPDLIVLDVMLPGIDGIEVCRRVRATSNTPIIMVTSRVEELDRLVGFGVGADDYVTKPFSPRELAARVQAVLRRTGAPPEATGDVLRAGTLRISARTRTVRDGERDIPLTAREFDLLYFIASHPGQVFTRDQLLDNVWGEDVASEPSTVTVHVRRLRTKLEADPSRPRYLKTIWGVGYKFDC